MRKVFIWISVIILSLLVIGALLAYRPVPSKIDYGVSFTKLNADELGLDWREVYAAALDDLGIRKFRLAAHWPMIEPERDQYDFSAMDYMVNEASARDAKIILAVGRRLPRWPECHTPEWVGYMPWDEQKMELRQYITAVIERYKDEPAITHWQVENEPYLSLFAHEICGEHDEEFLKEEVALVKSLDPSRPILVTDSGNLGTWHEAYRTGDAFGTSLYIYFWNPELGEFKTRIPAFFYRIKARLMEIFLGEKPVILIELSAEPWLVTPTRTTPFETQLARMDIEKFREIIDYAEKTRFSAQYLWGVEWWYYMREHDHPEFWAYAKTIYQK